MVNPSYADIIASLPHEEYLSYPDRLILADFLEDNEYFGIGNILSLLRDKNRECLIYNNQIIPGDYPKWLMLSNSRK